MRTYTRAPLSARHRAPYEVSVQGGDPYRGHDGVLNWWKDSFAVLSDLRAEVYEVRDLGAITFVHGCLRGQGAESGAAFGGAPMARPKPSKPPGFRSSCAWLCPIWLYSPSTLMISRFGRRPSNSV